jgi:hypothetical protein
MTRRTIARVAALKPSRSRSATYADWFPVIAFSAIGLLVALNIMFRFPEWGALIASMNQFGG